LIRSDRTVDAIEETFTADSGLIDIFPNPARAMIDVRLYLDVPIDGVLNVLSSDGRVVHNQTLDLATGLHHLPLEVWSYPPGLYVVEILDRTRRYSDTFVVIAD